MFLKTFPSLETETQLFARGFRFVIGIDEVGRGAIAGPVSVGLTLLDSTKENLNSWPEKLQDSKLMTPRSRDSVYAELLEWVPSHSVGSATNDEIDSIGINDALALAAGRGLSELTKSPELRSLMASEGAVILLDGSYNWLGSKASGLSVETKVKADVSCVSVAAAAVIAKVKRDRLMEELSEQFSQYGLESNRGYAAAKHIEALRTIGPSPIHRLTWLTRILGQEGE
jgi:ribonuclease HII